MAELADAQDLKSCSLYRECGSESHPRHRSLMLGRLAQLVRAFGLHPKGRGFDPLSDHRMKKKLLLSILIIFVIISIFVYRDNQQPNLFPAYKQSRVHIGNSEYRLYHADDDEKRAQGLSNTEKLPADQGIMFVFASKEKYSFWMKDMKYSLDFIFLDNNVVVDIYEDIRPDSYPNIISPRRPVNKVIELNAGEIKKAGITIGDKLKE